MAQQSILKIRKNAGPPPYEPGRNMKEKTGTGIYLSEQELK